MGIARRADSSVRRAVGFWRSARANPALLLVLVVGVVLRAVLMPLTHGQDFVVWDKAATATLNGDNVYAHHPDYPGGPYAYFPLFLYLELPFRWLAGATGIGFTVLGKLAIMAGDLVATMVLAAEIGRRGRSARQVALGAALFFLNPLLLYNGAFYGRFDSVGLALLLAAFWWYRPGRPLSWRTSMLYAAAIAAKTFPMFMAPKLIAFGRVSATRILVTCLAVLGGISLPYLLTSPRAFLTDVFLYDAKKLPQGLSWQQLVLAHISADSARRMSYVFLVAFMVGVLVLVRVPDLETYCLLTLLLFLLSSKVVLEQYLLWPMPWLVLRTYRPASPGPALVTGSTGMLAALTVIGMLANPYVHPFGRQPGWIAVLLAALLAGYCVAVLREESRRTGSRPQTRTTPPSQPIS